MRLFRLLEGSRAQTNSYKFKARKAEESNNWFLSKMKICLEIGCHFAQGLDGAVMYWNEIESGLETRSKC